MSSFLKFFYSDLKIIKNKTVSKPVHLNRRELKVKRLSIASFGC